MPFITFQNLQTLPKNLLLTLLINLRTWVLHTKVFRTSAIFERHVIERHLSDNRHIKIMFHFICHWLCYFTRGSYYFPP